MKKKIALILGAILGFGLVPMLMGPTGGLPAKPRFISVGIGGPAQTANTLSVSAGAGIAALSEFSGNGNTFQTTSFSVGQDAVGNGQVYNRGAFPLNLGANGTTNALVLNGTAATANVATFTITSVNSNANINDTTATNSPSYNLTRGGTLDSFIGAVGTASALATGAAVGDMVLRCQTAACRLLGSTDAGSTSNPLAMISQSSGTTCTVSGFTTSPTPACKFTVLNGKSSTAFNTVGALICWEINSFSATSNATTFQMTLPAHGATSNGTPSAVIQLIDNSVHKFGLVRLQAGSTLSFSNGPGTGGGAMTAFTNTGTKGLSESFNFCYPLT